MKKTIEVKGIKIKRAAEGSGKNWVLFGFYDGTLWYNMWAADWNTDLQNAVEGDTVEICFIKKEYKGKPQYEIIDPSTPEVAAEQEKETMINEMTESIKKLENRLEICEARLDEQEGFNDEGTAGS